MDFQSLDPVMLLAFALGGTLLACLGIFFAMRDQASAPPRHFRMVTTCPQMGQRAVVDVVEERRSGMLLRSALHCTLRQHGAHCHEQCTWRPSE